MFRKSLYACAFFVLILSLGTSYGDVNNILTNPGFESGTTGWAARGCTFATTTSQKHSGSNSGRAYSRTDTWQGIQQDVLGKMVVGQTYAVSGYVRTSTSASSTVHLSFEKTDGDGTTYAWAASGNASSSGWTYISGNYTLTVNGTLTGLKVYVEGPASGVDIYLDDVNVFVPGPDATGNVNVNVRHQVLDGFGGAGAWYEGDVITYGNSHPEIYNILFRDLGLDIYRIRNTYQIDSGYITRTAQIVASANAALGRPLRIMNTSWSPPASLKSNGSTVGGTLAKDGSGNYRYADFAQWWRNSLTAWSNAGVNTYYINMQNEPHWTASWDTCYLGYLTSDPNARYEPAFAALYANLNTMPNRPLLLAPEGQDIGLTDDYVNSLTSADKSNIYGYSHHLYGGDANNPDGFITPMTNLKTALSGDNKPLLQTEYSRGGLIDQWANAMNLAILIHNALTVEEVTAYLYWDLFWASPGGLVSISSTSYTINPVYYAMKHYSYFTDPNWQRVDANNSSPNLRISAFIDPNDEKLSVIIINTSTTTDMTLALSFTGFTVIDGNVWRSTSTQNCVLIGSFNPANQLSLPANSITTLALSSLAPDTTPPANPTGLTATAGDSQVSLNWNDNSEIDLAGYNVYRSLTSGSGYVKINGALVTSSAYIDNNVDGYVTYYYVVRAVDIFLNESGNSNQASATPTDTTPPSAPTGLSATAGNGTVSLNWSDNGEDDFDGYNVYRSTTLGSGYVQLNGSLLTSSGYVDNSVTNGITYYYVVTAVDTSSNESIYSNEVSALPQLYTDVEILGSWVSGLGHPKEAGTKRALIFIAHEESANGNPYLSSVTYGGQAMTKIIEVNAVVASGNYVAAFILNEANIAAASDSTFTPTWSGTTSSTAYASVFLQNVDQTTSVGASAKNSSTSSTPNPITTSALATNNRDMVILGATCGSVGFYTLNNNFVEGNDQQAGGTAGMTGVTGHKSATGADETPSATYSATPNRQAIIGFVVKSAPLVLANNPPTVSITSPLNDAIFAKNANITIDAIASDTDGSVTKVEFFEGSTKLGEDTTSSYSYMWNNVPTGHYTLTAKATDDDSNSTTSLPVNITVLGEEGTGAVLCEWWTGIAGTAVSDLTSDVNYPDNSSGRELLTSMQGPTNWGDNYGNRIRGYLNPVTSDDYTFWIASDADSELWLSTDDNPANASLIASAPSSTQSSPISLTAGQKYYIEVLHKAGIGNDNISVAWQGPGITQQVIDGIYLSPCCLGFKDFAGFTGQWNLTGCNTGNDWCDGFDFNRDGSVLLDDLKIFTDWWLTGLE